MPSSFHALYKIYYAGDVLVYVGRTNQPIRDRMRGHFFSRPMHKPLDILLVDRIEFTTLKSEADMYIYEVYYINKFKPPCNVDDKSTDEVTLTLPELQWEEWRNDELMSKWRSQRLAEKLYEERVRKERQEQCRRLLQLNDLEAKAESIHRRRSSGHG